MDDVTTVSWWLDTAKFYENARIEMPRMSRVAEDDRRGPRMNQHRLTAAQKRRLKALEE